MNSLEFQTLGIVPSTLHILIHLICTIVGTYNRAHFTNENTENSHAISCWAL